MAFGFGLMFVYYSTVYSTILDVIEPSLRGTAMALYFFAMYVFGASFGPVITGFLSERFTQSAATAADVVTLTKETLEPFRAAGLHSAMYLVPVLGALLAFVLFAASCTVGKDMENMQRWMLKSHRAPMPDDVLEPPHSASGL